MTNTTSLIYYYVTMISDQLSLQGSWCFAVPIHNIMTIVQHKIGIYRLGGMVVVVVVVVVVVGGGGGGGGGTFNGTCTLGGILSWIFCLKTVLIHILQLPRLLCVNPMLCQTYRHPNGYTTQW